MGAATTAFYLNGSYTSTDDVTGEKTSYTGPEALSAAWASLSSLSTSIGEVSTRMYEIYKRKSWSEPSNLTRKSWSEIYSDIVETFRNPATEAAEVLGVAHDASPETIRKAHRQLARLHHPDKVDAEFEEEARLYMQKLNWAKEVLLPKGSS